MEPVLSLLSRLPAINMQESAHYICLLKDNNRESEDYAQIMAWLTVGCRLAESLLMMLRPNITLDCQYIIYY
jgi:hypothetical protein